MESEETKEFNLNEAFDALEEITERLSDEDISLEDSFKAYKEGMELVKKCNDSIDRVEKMVLVLEEEGGVHELQ